MRSVTNSMGSVVKGMDKAMESMNLERVSRTQAVRRGVRIPLVYVPSFPSYPEIFGGM